LRVEIESTGALVCGKFSPFPQVWPQLSPNFGSPATTANRLRCSLLLIEHVQPVGHVLQDEDGGVLVDDFGTPHAADVFGDQLALDCRGRQPLVPQPDRQRGQPGQIAGEGAGRLRPGALAAVHVDRQAEHEAVRAERDRPKVEDVGSSPIVVAMER
jgi:hypothetical protein